MLIRVNEFLLTSCSLTVWAACLVGQHSQ